jgi:hypothetical protein
MHTQSMGRPELLRSPSLRTPSALAWGLRFLFALLAAVAVLRPPAEAAQVTYSTTVAIQRTPWTNTVTLPQFDPFLGTLQGVTVVLDYTIRSSSRIENLDAVPRPGVIHGATETLNVWDSLATSLLGTTASVKFTNSLAAYDGTSDFGGASGVSLARRTVTGSATNLVLGSLTPFEGVGTLPFAIEAQGTGFALNVVTFLQQVLPEAGGTLTVIYDYEEATQGATIGDWVWNDADGLGDQTPGELGLAGVTVTLLDSTGSSLVDFPPVQTDGGGYYAFVGVPPGDYLVVIEPPVGFVATYDLDGVDPSYTVAVTVVGGEVLDSVDFGFAQLGSNLGDRVWRDDNGDGQQDPGEPGLEGVTVTLYDSTGSTVLATTTTDFSGGYGFAGLPAGDYLVTATGQPSGYVATAVPGTVSLVAGTTVDTADFGFQPRVSSVSGVVWQDGDRDGISDVGETGLSGVVVNLYDTTGTVVLSTVNTDTAGAYSFAGLAAGHYLIVVTAPGGYWATYDADGIGTPNQSEVTLAALEEQTDIRFGYSGGTLGDRVWNDLNGDGIQDVGEPGFAGATVTLNTGASTTTDANGFYSFTDLPVATYTVTVTVPSGWTATGDPDGVLTPGVAVVTLVSGSDLTTVDFGYQQWTALIGDRVWRDDDADGVQDLGEPGLAGVGIELRNAAGTTVLATATTDANGFYNFPGLAPGTYTVVTTQPANHLPSFDVDGLTVPNRSVVTLAPAESRDDVDFGYQPLSSLGSLVWLDFDGNGVFNPGAGEFGLPTAVVTVSGTGGTFTTTTDFDGLYLFTGLPAGTYSVSVTAPPGLDPTYDLDGISTPGLAVVVIAPAVDRLDVNFGYNLGSNLSDAQVGNLVWLDVNNNGLLDGLEAGIPNVQVVLKDGLGATVGTLFTDASGQYLFSGLPAGNYTVLVTRPSGTTPTYDFDGIGTPDQVTVGLSNGEKRLDQDFGYRVLPPLLATVSGTVWDDADGNGSVNGGETGLPGLTVTLFNGSTVVASLPTGPLGQYSFAGIPAGNYTVQVTPPTYWGATFDADGLGTPNAAAVVLAAGQNLAGVDFGYQYAPPPGSLGDRVWLDADANGMQDVGESGVPGTVVELRDGDGVLLGTVTTDAGGYYGFLSVPAGTYTVTITPPAYHFATGDLDGPGTPNVTSVTLAIGQERDDVDFGVQYNPPPALIGDRVWDDQNSNGIQDPGEPGLIGLSVILKDASDAVVATATTDATGTYEFTGVTAGAYTVSVAPPLYYIPTFDLDGIATTNVVSITAAIGETNRTVDFGLVYAPPLGSLGEYVWNDANTNGVRDPGEAGLTNLVVTLSDSANVVVATTTTDSDGQYKFTGLSARGYRVTVAPPTNAIPTFDLDGVASTNLAVVTLAIGENRTDVNFGYALAATGTIGNQVWVDLDNNGVLNGAEVGLTNVVVTLRDGVGDVVATATTDASGNYLFTGLAADTYTVSITPPANHFASYDLDGVVTPNTATLLLLEGDQRLDVDFGLIYVEPDSMSGSIGDLVWSDANGNGIREVSEPGLTNVVVELRNAGGGVVAVTSTSSTGAYTFTGLGAGSYTVVVLPPAYYTPTYDRDGISTANQAVVELANGQGVTDADFGYCPPSLATIGDRVWIDANSNGIQNSAEVGLTNVVVVLRNSGGTPLATNYTGANGRYAFSNLVAGTYQVTVVPPANYGPTFDADGLSTPNRATVSVTWGESRLNVDFGYVFCPGTGRIGDLVWVDSNGNGLRDGCESGLPNATVRLYDFTTGALLATRTTDCNGYYQFTALFAGTYRVTVTPPCGYTPTYDLDGILTPDTTVVTLNNGQVRTDVDFGYMTEDVRYPTGTGCTPGFWGNRGLRYVTASDLAYLSSLRLVEENGSNADFLNPLTGAFGSPYAANYSQAVTRFDTFVSRQNAVNMAAQLSRHLAAFVLNTRHGFIGQTQQIPYSLAVGGTIAAQDLVTLANNALQADQYTPSGDANRAYQTAIKDALDAANNAARRQ